jgi:uncharacterized alpha-E superfamily protein
MLSRVADSLYWMSRYMERTDNLLRMLKINYAYSQDDMIQFTWQPVLEIYTPLNPEEISDINNKSNRSVLCFMILEKNNPNSIINLVTKARENARSVQDHITKELWQCLNEFYLYMRDTPLEQMLQSQDPITILDLLIKQGLIYYGTTEITMMRGEGLSFMSIGKYIERILQSTQILDVKFSSLSYDLDKSIDTTYWKYLLLSISGYQLYLKSYRSGFEGRNIAHLILFNIHFPRSVMYSLNQLTYYFERLKNDRTITSYESVSFMIGKLRSKVQYSTVDSVAESGLHKYLTEIISEINTIGKAFNNQYFAYS